MLPFPIISNTNILPDPSILVDIDFNRQQLGSSTVQDRTGRSYSTLKGSGCSVINDPVQGNVMYFPGTGSFSTPINDSLKLSSINWDLRIVFKSLSTSINQVLWETGNYVNDGTIVQGMSYTLNQYPSQYIQGFVVMNPSNYNRILLDGSNTSEWETVIMQVRSTSITIKNERTGLQNVYSRFEFGNGTQFSVGGSYASADLPYFFNGYMRSLYIQKV